MARGDRLAVDRTLLGSTVTYLHHGIDLGDGTVVHARPDDFRNPFAGGRIVRTTLEAFALGRPVRTVVDPPARFGADAIVDRAVAAVGREGYSPVVDNCEHFATWCATGRRASRQVDLVMTRVSAMIGRAAAAFSARGAVGVAERIVVRTALGTAVRLGPRSLVPAAIVAEGAALAAEWRAHQAGLTDEASRRSGARAGLATSGAAFALAGVPGGAVGMLTGALAGAAVWTGGSAAAAAAAQAAGRLVPSSDADR
ncbi:MAG: lecithin retinol acyltransferase family protein [Planctomycetia bacterium]